MSLHEEVSTSSTTMNTPLKNLLFLLLFLFSITLYARDINIDALVAKTNSKPLFLFFHKPHCGHCSHMLKFTLADKQIKHEIDTKFVYVDMYIKESGMVTYKDFKGTRRDFAKYLGYDFYPTSIFIDETGAVVNATPGAREQDYFIDVLNYVSTKQYKKMEFETYLDTLDFNSDS